MPITWTGIAAPPPGAVSYGISDRVNMLRHPVRRLRSVTARYCVFRAPD
jgi:hypothetical protein